MNFVYKDNGIYISEADNFDIEQTFDCGQCFRFAKTENGSYSGIAHNRRITLEKRNNGLFISEMSMDEFNETWLNYLCLNMDYNPIKSAIATDDIIINAIKYASGIRILRQDLWETIISFIISQNNNIPRIKKIIENMCRSFGTCLNDNDYLFPTLSQLEHVTNQQLKDIGLGYRDEYIIDAVNKIACGTIDLDELKSYDTQKARNVLMSIKGVGGKVADCILLFSLSRYEVCPHDVWIKRIFKERYNLKTVNEKNGYELATGKWGKYAGIAQQYLFYYERDNYSRQEK